MFVWFRYSRFVDVCFGWLDRRRLGWRFEITWERRAGLVAVAEGFRVLVGAASVIGLSLHRIWRHPRDEIVPQFRSSNPWETQCPRFGYAFTCDDAGSVDNRANRSR